MTWAEAKAKSVIASNSGSNCKIKTQLGKNHAAVLAAKILAKNGPDENERIRDRQAAKQARKDQQRQEQLHAQHESEKERQRLGEVMRPHEMALEKMQQLANEYQQGRPMPSSLFQSSEHKDVVHLTEICESKQLQVDEMLALQAIYADTDNLIMVDPSSTDSSDQLLETLQVKLDEWQSDTNQEVLQRSVVEQPTISFTLKRSMEDSGEDDTNIDDDNVDHDDDDDGGDYVAHILFHVSFPSDYPLRTTPPIIKVVWFLLTRKFKTVAINKPLDSTNLGTLDERGMLQAMTDYAQEQLVGVPSVYALLDTWLSEHLFTYITWNLPQSHRRNCSNN